MIACLQHESSLSIGISSKMKKDWTQQQPKLYSFSKQSHVHTVSERLRAGCQKVNIALLLTISSVTHLSDEVRSVLHSFFLEKQLQSELIF